MIAIACIDNNWAIGKDNHLLFRIPEDMALFKILTMKGIVVMGMNTWKSMSCEPLPGRINLVVTSSDNKDDEENKIYFTSFDKVIEKIDELKDKYNKTDTNVFLIGGGQLYESLIDECSKAIISHVSESVKDTDTFFPNLNRKDNWKLSDIRINHCSFSVLLYEKIY